MNSPSAGRTPGLRICFKEAEAKNNPHVRSQNLPPGKCPPMHLRSLRGLCVIFLSCLFILNSHAQNSRFSGQITDPQGAAIPSASIQVVNQETQVKREAVSDGNG